jgi:hypothetical protein
MTDPAAPVPLKPEDAKILTLARAARARNSAVEAAAVRDNTGRTYVAIPVALPSLKLSALQVAVAMAIASGAAGLEAAAVVRSADSPDSLPKADLGAARDLKTSVVLLAGPESAPPDWTGVRRLV